MPLTSIPLAVSRQENATFPWRARQSAKEVLIFLGGHHQLPRNIESLAVNWHRQGNYIFLGGSISAVKEICGRQGNSSLV